MENGWEKEANRIWEELENLDYTDPYFDEKYDELEQAWIDAIERA